MISQEVLDKISDGYTEKYKNERLTEGSSYDMYCVINDSMKEVATMYEKEIRGWRELVESMKVDHQKEVDVLKYKEGQALIKAGNHFDHLMEYMQCVESIVGFAGPVEIVKHELDLIVGSRKDYLDYIDRARLGLCLVKEMIEENKLDKDNALAILEKALY